MIREAGRRCRLGGRVALAPPAAGWRRRRARCGTGPHLRTRAPTSGRCRLRACDHFPRFVLTRAQKTCFIQGCRPEFHRSIRERPNRPSARRRHAAGDAADAPSAHMQEIFAAQRAAFAADMSPSRDVRVDRLDRLLRLTEEHQGEIVAAISADFGHRSRHETDLADIFIVISGIRHTRRNVGRWMKPRHIATPLAPVAGAQRGRAAAARCHRGDQPVELSVPARDAACRRGAGCRQPGDAEAERADPTLLRVAAADRRRIVRGRRVRSDPGGRRGRSCVCRPAIRPSLLHRLDGRRPPGGAGRRTESHAGHARARRKIAGDHRRRLRHRRCGGTSRIRQASQRGSDLRGARLHAGAARAHRRVRGGDARPRSPGCTRRLPATPITRAS